MKFDAKRFKSWWVHKDFQAFLLLCLFLPLFFYNLGAFSLQAFDEAWYGEIARQILKTGDLLKLTFNNESYIEHPPLGFILIAASFLTFGVNEFGVRFFSALGGFGCLYFTYLIGKKIANQRVVGLAASLIVVSCVWFIFRSRSGNLDTIFLFFYLFCFYAALKVKGHRVWWYVFAGLFTLTFLAKTLAGITLIIPVTILFFVQKVKPTLRQIVLGILLFIILVGPWLFVNVSQHGWRFISHLYYVGVRPFARTTPNFRDLGNSLTFQYIHFGMRKWYRLVIIALVGGLFLIRKNLQLMSLYALLFIFLISFLTNQKTEIWHLIPLYPFLAILTALFWNKMVGTGFKIISWWRPQLKLNLMTQAVTIFPIAALALWQIYLFRGEVKLFDRDQSGLAVSAHAALGRPESLYFYADFFLPTAVFYSQKRVEWVNSQPHPKNTLPGFVTLIDRPVLLLTEKWRLGVDKINPTAYEIVKEYKEYVLLYLR